MYEFYDDTDTQDLLELPLHIILFLNYNFFICGKKWELDYNTTGATIGGGIAYPSGAPEFTPGF